MEETENQILDKLYRGVYKASIQLISNGSKQELTLNLRDRNGKPDCCISSYEKNLFIRTSKGLNYQKYSSLGHLRNSCKTKLLEHNMTPIYLVVKSSTGYKYKYDL